jgi:hypothetical protein
MTNLSNEEVQKHPKNFPVVVVRNEDVLDKGIAGLMQDELREPRLNHHQKQNERGRQRQTVFECQREMRQYERMEAYTVMLVQTLIRNLIVPTEARGGTKKVTP